MGVDRNDKTKTSHAKGLTPMERFETERSGDVPWHNVEDVSIPKN